MWCTGADPWTVWRLAGAGFNWVALDLQHGRYDRQDLLSIARGWPGPADMVVRVPALDFATIGLAADAGAAAVIVPQIENATQAKAAVEATHYPPLGRRSAGQLAPSWGGPARDHVGCAVMVESATGLAHVEAIAAVPGVAMIFIGPYDLALSLGTTVEALLNDRSLASPLTRITTACDKAGLPVGAYGGNPKTSTQFAVLGINVVAVATDSWITTSGAATSLSLTADES